MIDTSRFSDKKTLLAFSGGIDSTALFFMLLEKGVKCDLAIVDYGVRKQSKDEVAYANELASLYDVKCFVKIAPRFETHFEVNARAFRYDFFEEIIRDNDYEVLLTAHQLNDRLEWLLMRLVKGAGLREMTGMQEVTQKDGYLLVRPLLFLSKYELQDYLRQKNIAYFVDETNGDERYERNYFRANFSDLLVSRYATGIKRSFAYLQSDNDILENLYQLKVSQKELRIVELFDNSVKVSVVDKYLKELGYLLSSAQRGELAKSKNIVVGGIWAVATVESIVYIAPYLSHIRLPKEFKERCRISKIPPNVRGYLLRENIKTVFDK